MNKLSLLAAMMGAAGSANAQNEVGGGNIKTYGGC